MKHKLTVNSIKSNGGDVAAENNFVRSEIESINDIPYEAFITRRQALGILPPSTFAFYYTSGEPDTYNFSSDDLAVLNSFGRRPILTAAISQDGGYIDAPDIVSSFTGSPGFYVSGFIKLHTDGNGNNPDFTYIQFS